MITDEAGNDGFGLLLQDVMWTRHERTCKAVTHGQFPLVLSRQFWSLSWSFFKLKFHFFSLHLSKAVNCNLINVVKLLTLDAKCYI